MTNAASVWRSYRTRRMTCNSHRAFITPGPLTHQRSVEASRRLAGKYDFVVTSGGIGPTHDGLPLLACLFSSTLTPIQTSRTKRLPRRSTPRLSRTPRRSADSMPQALRGAARRTARRSSRPRSRAWRSSPPPQRSSSCSPSSVWYARRCMCRRKPQPEDRFCSRSCAWRASCACCRACHTSSSACSRASRRTCRSRRPTRARCACRSSQSRPPPTTTLTHADMPQAA
jgi:hypothetical protein